MNEYIKYTSQPNLIEKRQILSLLDEAFIDKIYSANTHYGFFCGYTCDYDNFVLLKKNDDVIGVAIVTKRKINLLNGLADALSVGPVAIDPSFQRQGYSSLLMAGLNDLADQFGVTILYLQGIDGFYNKYDYYTCSSKSKLVFKGKEFNKISGVSIKPLTVLNVNDIKEVYKNNADLCSCTSVRSNEDWDWLVKHGCNTWYFFGPTLVLNNDKPIGYFCSDPKDPARIREAVFDASDEGIQSFFAGLRIYCQRKSVEKSEIMTWIGSPLYTYAKRNCNADFLQFFKKDGSQMMKILNYQKVLDLMSKSGLSDFLINNIECRDDECVFSFEFVENLYPVKIATKYVPGLICGYFDFRVMLGFEEIPPVLKEKVTNFFNNFKPPFFFQGDNF